MIAVPTPTIVVLGGDETGQELLLEALRVIAPDVIGMAVELEHFDLSLARRRATKNAIVSCIRRPPSILIAPQPVSFITRAAEAKACSFEAS